MALTAWQPACRVTHMSSILTFGVCAFDCNVRVETACRDAYEVLQEYIFPSIARGADVLATHSIVVRTDRFADEFQVPVNVVQVASANTPISLALVTIKALDDAVIQRLKTLHAVHAGAVLFGNQAMLIPGATHAGKSSVVAELLRRGATYLSDEYALIDTEGQVHPYPRPLLLRNGHAQQIPTLPGEVNASFADRPAPIRWILSLEYQPQSAWNIQKIPQGEPLMI